MAARHLQQAGLLLVARNYRCPRGELDLVMRAADLLVFVEVRYRRSTTFGSAAESVDAIKRQRLIFAAQHYLQKHPQAAQSSCRFDVVVVAGAEGDPSLEWIQDAFRA